jgi:thymidylate synthase
MTLSINNDLTIVVARDLPEAWYDCVKGIMDYGYEYLITRGSFAGQKRKEFDSIVIEVMHPSSKPMVPDTPLGVPPPCSMDYVEQYLPYLMTSDKSQGELYTYGEDIDIQLPELIRILKEAGEGTNQACMSIGSSHSILLEHSQCLRLIDTRIREDKLHFHVYFRSWDLWSGFPANLAAIQILKEYVASEVGVEDGKLFAYSKGLHLYDHHWNLANLILRR